MFLLVRFFLSIAFFLSLKYILMINHSLPIRKDLSRGKTAVFKLDDGYLGRNYWEKVGKMRG